MGQSRFLKTIRARHAHGAAVVKVYLKPDSSLSLQAIHRRLKGQFHHFLTESVVYLCLTAQWRGRRWRVVRMYWRIRRVSRRSGRAISFDPGSLATFTIELGTLCPLPSHLHALNRLPHSTRPFLSSIEKKWIAFQLLTALKHARERNVTKFPSLSSSLTQCFAGISRRHQDGERTRHLVELDLPNRLRLLQTHSSPPRRPLNILLLLRHLLPTDLLPRPREILRRQFRNGQEERRPSLGKER